MLVNTVTNGLASFLPPGYVTGMAPLTNAERQAAYRQRLKDAAKIPPGDLKALADRADGLAKAAPSLRQAVEAMPEGPDKDAARRHLDDLREVGKLLGKVKRLVRDKKREAGEA